jgi:O-antigen ligase
MLAAVAGSSVDNDLFARMQQLVESTNPILLLFSLIGLLALLALALFGRRLTLFAILIIAASLTGAIWQSVDVGSTILRWVVLALLAFNILRLKTNPGWPLIFYLIFIWIGIAFVPLSETLTWSVQISGLLILSSTAAVVLADSVQTTADLRRVLNIFLGAAAVWLTLALIAVPQLLSSRGERYSGAVSSVSHFVITGGMLLPIVVGSAFVTRKKRWKFAIGMLAVLIFVVLAVSGQRTGTFAGVLGTLPVIASRGRKAIAILAAAALLLLFVASVLSVINPNQVEFVVKRFSSADTTGRTELWAEAFRECMKSPILGRGHGGDRAWQYRTHHPTHSAYLSVWQNTGLFGLLMFLASLFSGLWISWRVYRQSSDPETRSIAIVLFGLLVAQIAAGFFETLVSPSSFASIVRLMTLALIGRVAAIPASVPSMNPLLYWEPRSKQWYMYVPGYYPTPPQRRA